MSERAFVWDTTGLLHASACGHVDWLLDAAGPERRHLVPPGVVEELERLGHSPTAERLELWEPEDLIEWTEKQLGPWLQRLGGSAGGCNSGEAWVAATAQTEDAVAIVDDREAQKVIKTWTPKLELHGVLWAISRGVQEGRVESAQAYSGLCDQMLKAHEGDEFSGLRWPFRPGGFPAWHAQACAKGEL